MQTLKPCICGKTPRIERNKGMAGITKVPFYREQIVCRCGVSSKLFKRPDQAIAAWNNRPAAPVEGLEPVLYIREDGVNITPSHFDSIISPKGNYSPLVTRSQAEAIIAAEWAEKEAWKNASIELDKAQEAIEADNAAKVEQERLRFEGDLDKWMKIIGAGITGYQPEAYALMDLACHDLVKLRSEIAAIAGQLDCEADGDSILNIIREDKADNASLTGRVKELGGDRDSWRRVAEKLAGEKQALETQLAAANEALDRIKNMSREDGPWDLIAHDMQQIAASAREVQP